MTVLDVAYVVATAATPSPTTTPVPAAAATGVPIWVLLAVAIITGLFTVGAQIISQAFTAKRESERLEWERDQKAIDDRRRDRDLVFESKRDLYLSVMRLSEERHDILQNEWAHYQGVEDFSPLFSIRSAWFDRWVALMTEVQLFSVTVSRAMADFAMAHTGPSALALGNEVPFSQAHLDSQQAQRVLWDALRRSLGIDPEYPDGDARRQSPT